MPGPGVCLGVRSILGTSRRRPDPCPHPMLLCLPSWKLATTTKKPRSIELYRAPAVHRRDLRAGLLRLPSPPGPGRPGASATPSWSSAPATRSSPGAGSSGPCSTSRPTGSPSRRPRVPGSRWCAPPSPVVSPTRPGTSVAEQTWHDAHGVYDGVSTTSTPPRTTRYAEHHDSGEAEHTDRRRAPRRPTAQHTDETPKV